MVRDYIKEQHPGLDVEILTMKTTGDKILDRTLDKVGGKGLFVKELDKALLEGRTMLSVHSLKDMPMEVPEDLPLLAFSRREDPRDVLVLPEGVASLDPLKPLGCSSLRRTLQLQTIYPDMKVKSIRGNLQTRCVSWMQENMRADPCGSRPEASGPGKKNSSLFFSR